MPVEIPAFQCPRCWADPTPTHLSKPRLCAFTKEGQFKPVNNWNCATLAVPVVCCDQIVQAVFYREQQSPLHDYKIEFGLK